MDGTRSPEQPVATRAVVSDRAPDADEGDWTAPNNDWLRDGIEKPTFRKYQKRVHGEAIAVGDEFGEFVNWGCASPQDVVLRVEEIVEGTEFEMRPPS